MERQTKHIIKKKMYLLQGHLIENIAFIDLSCLGIFNVTDSELYY